HKSVRLIARNDHAKRLRSHSAIGCSATFQRKMRLPTSRPTNTYNRRKDAVRTTKKSVVSTDGAWFRTNVLHASVPRRRRGRHLPSHRSRRDSNPELAMFQFSADLTITPRVRRR